MHKYMFHLTGRATRSIHTSTIRRDCHPHPHTPPHPLRYCLFSRCWDLPINVATLSYSVNECGYYYLMNLWMITQKYSNERNSFICVRLRACMCACGRTYVCVLQEIDRSPSDARGTVTLP